MDQGIDASVGQRQENVELPARLLGQGGPQPELEHLPGRARLMARPGQSHAAELIAGVSTFPALFLWRA